MIDIKNLKKSFGNKTVLKDIDLLVKDGEIFGFLGPNGAGKTTTIKMIVGLLIPDGGTIEVQGINVVDEPLEAKKRISYVPDNPDIYEQMTGIQYLNFLSDVYGVSVDERKSRIDKLAELFSMSDDLRGFISSYSHGMKQKIVLIGALVTEPEVLILDEPMVGLDPKSAFKLKEIMREMADKGRTVFFSTHVMEVAEKLCDRIAIINKGEIIEVGTLEEIRDRLGDDGSLEKVFLELTGELDA
ncbi:MAG: ABC transporter ATP-binding protein [Tissierellia bacterium]|nr:ABC transporter ATP-binding protein [Tissierellia bacterium]